MTGVVFNVNIVRMEDLQRFIDDTQLNVDINTERHEFYKYSRRMKSSYLIGVLTCIAGYALQKQKRNYGQVLMIAGISPIGLYGVYNWSQKDVAYTLATDKIIAAVRSINPDYCPTPDLLSQQLVSEPDSHNIGYSCPEN